MKEINEQHPHRDDWLCEIVFGRERWLGYHPGVSYGRERDCPQAVTARCAWRSAGQRDFNGSWRLPLQILDQRIATERYEIEHEPEEERAELVSIYQNKGFSGPLLQHVVNHLTANKERWHRAMVHDELGVVENTHINPWLEGVQVGLAFVVGGLIPTLPVFFSLPQARWWTYGLTALATVVLGAMKARYTHQGPLWAGLEFLVVVSLGTLAGVGLGLRLHGG